MGQNQYDNLLLEKLPQPDRLAITSRLEEVVIPAGTVLYDAEQVPRHAWFITAGVVSKMIAMSDGRSAEVAVSGREGVIPSFQLVGNAQHGLLRCVTQTETRALRMPFPEMLREFRRSEPLRHLVLRCVQRRSMILAQIGACNRLHNTEERLARWLHSRSDGRGQRGAEPRIPGGHPGGAADDGDAGGGCAAEAQADRLPAEPDPDSGPGKAAGGGVRVLRDAAWAVPELLRIGLGSGKISKSRFSGIPVIL